MLATYYMEDLRFQHHGASHYGQVCLVFVKFLYYILYIRNFVVK